MHARALLLGFARERKDWENKYLQQKLMRLRPGAIGIHSYVHTYIE